MAIRNGKPRSAVCSPSSGSKAPGRDGGTSPEAPGSRSRAESSASAALAVRFISHWRTVATCRRDEGNANATMCDPPDCLPYRLAKIDQTPFEIQILDLSHDGRGVARRPAGHANAGKTVFVSGALPGETVMARQTARSRRFEDARTLEGLVNLHDRV